MLKNYVKYVNLANYASLSNGNGTRLFCLDKKQRLEQIEKARIK